MDKDKSSFLSSDPQGKLLPEPVQSWPQNRKVYDPHQLENWIKRSSHASDTSSAYSGSDVMQLSADDLDVESSGGLPESDGEEGFSESLIVRDQVREYLEKDPSSRTDHDIEVLLEFMQHMPAFSNMTLTVRRALCSVLTFAVVPKGDTTIYGDGQEVDSWSVIINGHVEISRPDGTIEHLHMGDSFGVSTAADRSLHCGTMKTKVDDCQFVHVRQHDYHKILNQGNQSISRLEEHGEVVLVVEKRTREDGKEGQVILRGTPDKLTLQLIENNATDPSYIEDFLLTYRTFLKSPLDVTRKLYSWLQDPVTREKAARIVMLWVNSHFRDFESCPEMMDFLEKFEVVLEEQKMTGQLRLLGMAYEARAHPRLVVLSRSTREEILLFSIVGGLEKKSGIFVAKVKKGSKASEAGLMRGDQILEVNKHNFELIHHDRALEILRSNTQLAVTVRSNLQAFRKVLRSSENPPQPNLLPKPTAVVPLEPLSKDLECLVTSAGMAELRQTFLKLDLKDDGSVESTGGSVGDQSVSRKNSSVSDDSVPNRPLSFSSPDLSSAHGVAACPAYSLPDQVMKIYRADQTFRYLLILKTTSAHEVVMLALTEFGITDPSCQYSLNEVTIEDCGLVKSRQLPDQLANLCERIRVNSRYYIRNMKSMELLIPDDQVEVIKREVQTNFLELESGELAIQLMRSDFKEFKDIEETEYIEDLFELGSRSGCPHLIKFIQLVNREMFWVVTEVCSEPIVIKRAKIMKQFIKLARCCKIIKNFNSMFAILSGLGHGAVSRLRQSWDKVPAKYMKLYEEMQSLMDPSRNMSKYRNLLSAHVAHPPVIPFFPLVKKDLTFIHYGNDSRVESLVNFDKLRMIAKEVHQLNDLASGVLPNSLAFYRNSSGEYTSLSTSALVTMKRKKSTATAPSLKKMYEDMLMARKARTYLMNLKVNEDENQLAQSSNLFEPPGKSTVRNVESSEAISVMPPSTESLAVNPMFGTDSQKAVHKLLTLTDKVKPLDQKRSTLHKISSVPSSPVRSPKKAHSSKPRPLLAVDLSRESSSVTGVDVKHRPSKGKGRLPANLPLSATVSKMLDSDSGYGSVTSSMIDTQGVDCVSESNSFTPFLQVPDSSDIQPRTVRPWSTGSTLTSESQPAAGHQSLCPRVSSFENQLVPHNSVAYSPTNKPAMANAFHHRPLRPPAYEDAVRYSALQSGCRHAGIPAPPNYPTPFLLPPPNFTGSPNVLMIRRSDDTQHPAARPIRERSYSFDMTKDDAAYDDYDDDEDDDGLSDQSSSDDDGLVSAV